MHKAELPAGLSVFDLSGRVALVTGGGRGLGQTIAVALASAGADVALVGRTCIDLEETAAQITRLGRTALPVNADVTEPADVERLTDAALGRFGRVDIIVNNAGVNVPKPVLDLSLDEWDRVQDLNARASFLVTRSLGPQMVERRYGRVINITSILASIAYENQGAYAASKGALTQFAKVLAVEWAPYDITVNCIGPTFFETERTRPRLEEPARRDFVLSRTPMGRWGQPNDLVGPVIFLASEASGFVTGQTIFVDGGWLAW
jgi:NAD(P)-dependent dehydrogenase (short-subunit alcohol dehydrogenase family)